MKAPLPSFECEYKSDRRLHRHRCRCCNKIINRGEHVVMTRVSKGSLAIHLLCFLKEHTPGGEYVEGVGYLDERFQPFQGSITFKCER